MSLDLSQWRAGGQGHVSMAVSAVFVLALPDCIACIGCRLLQQDVFDPSVAITVAGGDAFLPVIGHVRTASYGWRHGSPGGRWIRLNSHVH